MSQAAPRGVHRLVERLVRDRLSPTATLGEWLNQGASPAEIADVLSTTPDVVSAAIRYLGVDQVQGDPRYMQRKWVPPDTSVISNPQTDADWYWLGWLTAQSTVNARLPQTRLTARRCDAHHIQRLVAHLGSDQLVRPVTDDHVGVVIHSTDLVDALALHGITPHSQLDRTRRLSPLLALEDPGSAAMVAWLRGTWDATATVGVYATSAPGREHGVVTLVQRSPRVWAATARILGAHGITGTSSLRHRRLKLSVRAANIERLAHLLYVEPAPSGPTVLLERQRRELRGVAEKSGHPVPPSLMAPAAPGNLFVPRTHKGRAGVG